MRENETRYKLGLMTQITGKRFVGKITFNFVEIQSQMNPTHGHGE